MERKWNEVSSDASGADDSPALAPATPLLNSAELLQGVVQLASEGIISIDARQRILLFNGGAEEIFGYKAAEVLGKRLEILIPERYRERHDSVHLPNFERAHPTSRRMGERSEVFGLRKGGEEFPAEISISKADVNGQRMYTAVVRDATERKQYEAALRERGDAAVRATRARDEILGVVAHDLRNPLSTVKMCASALSTRVSQPDVPETAAESVRELSDVIQGAAEWMEHIIRDLLDVTALEAGRLSVVPVALPVEDVLDAVENMYGPIARDAGVGFDVRTEGDPPPPVFADAERLLQAIGNLVGNAIKFTPQGGRVEMVATTTGGTDADDIERVCFRISDTGPGIAADQLPRIFDRFWQVRKTIRAGAGLGLAIAKGIAEAHGGALDVESMEGVGTHFRLYVPTTL